MKKLTEFLSQCQNVALSTQAGEEHPFSSYAPFHYDEEAIYTLLPSISNHVENIEQSAKSVALFVEMNAMRKSVAERYQVTLECHIKQLSKQDTKYDEMMSKFETGTLGILVGVEEMLLYRMKVLSGEVTFGFGNRSEISVDTLDKIVF